MAMLWVKMATLWSGWAWAMPSTAARMRSVTCWKVSPSGGAPLGGAEEKLLALLGVEVAQLAEGHIFVNAQPDLPQRRIQMKGQAPGPGDRLGGGPGALEVAGIGRVDRYVREAPGQGLDLPQAVGGDVAVIPAVGAAVQVALGLGVADDVKCGQSDPLFAG